MKKNASRKIAVFLIAVLLVACLALTACTKEKTVKFSATTHMISPAAQVNLDINVQPEGEEYEVTFEPADILAFDAEGKFIYVKDADKVTVATEVAVTVKLKSDESVYDTQNFTVLPAEKSKEYITFNANKYTVGEGDPAEVTVGASDNGGYDVTYSKSGIVVLVGGYLKVIEAPEQDEQITVTVSLKSNPSVIASKIFTVKAKEEGITLKVKSDKSEIKDVKAGEAKDVATITVEKSDPNAEVTLSVNSEYVRLNDDNTLEIVKEVPYDTMVTVTATLKDDATVTSKASIILRALQVAGSVKGANGLSLTTDMFSEANLSNPSITAKGVVIDYYKDFVKGADSYENSYTTSVMMNSGKWVGTWYITPAEGQDEDDVTKLTDMYVKGGETIKYAYDKTTGEFSEGTSMYKVYIGKDNQLVRKLVTTTDSIPVAWENQHLYNPNAHFAVNVEKKFEYSEKFDLAAYGYEPTEYSAFRYKIAADKAEDWYFATYLSIAFTPMLSDTLNDIYVIVGKDGIVGMVAETEHILYGTTTSDGTPIEDAEATGESYTLVNIKFSGIGTTVVDDALQPYVGKYENPSNMFETTANMAIDALTKALTKMKGAKNYTFFAEDTTTYEPTINEDDYQASNAASNASVYSASNATGANEVSSTGKVGRVGYITEDTILFKDTGKYTASMDDKLYHTESSGYKKIDANTYDEVEYSSELGVMHGVKQRKGDFASLIPQFNFSADMFTYKRSAVIEGTKIMAFELVLRDPTISKDIAVELSMHNNAKNAVASVGSTFSLWVDENGNLIKSVYQYDLVSGTYKGYITTTYSGIGTTTIDEEIFDGYVPREIKKSWAEYTNNYCYRILHETSCSKYGCYDEKTGKYNHAGHIGSIEEELKLIFGSDFDVSKVPSPEVFVNIFGDNINAPSYDFSEVEIATGEYKYVDMIRGGFSYERSDENAKIYQEDYDKIVSELKTELAKLGYDYNKTNSNADKNVLEGGSRYVSFVNSEAGVQIVIENNFTRYFWFKIIKIGEWTLSK